MANENKGFFYEEGEELETIKFISEEEAGIFDEKIELKQAPKLDAPKKYQAKDVQSWAPKGKRKLVKKIDLPFSPVKAFFIVGSISLIVGLGFVVYTVSKIVMSGIPG